MQIEKKNEEIRWKIIKAMLKEFPSLKEKVRSFLEEQDLKR